MKDVDSAGNTAAADFLVVGSGIAGLYAALRLAAVGRVVVLTKNLLSEGNTQFAQGGIAVAFDEQDSPELHLQDTIRAGAGLCAEPLVRVMVQDGPTYVRDLISLGAHFDRHNGRLALAREGAHSLRRVLHARGDATGEEIEEVLSHRARSVPVPVHERVFAARLAIEGGRCTGAVGVDAGGHVVRYRSPVTILATGGAGQIYASTTNATVVTGDGMAMAMRAGAEIMDMEFFQFHPTGLAMASNPRFLISEAVRGDGALLLNMRQERFMPSYHPLGELAPRDVVARAISAECARESASFVWLDARRLSSGPARLRFPTIHARCLQSGLDMETDLIPVAPVAHYSMGGVRIDSHGRTTVPGLFACGETACLGVHGANRLASNSLLESLVFAGRAAEYAASWDGLAWRTGLLPPQDGWRPAGDLPWCLARPVGCGGGGREPHVSRERYPVSVAEGMSIDEIVFCARETMSRDLGLVREGEGLARGSQRLGELSDSLCALHAAGGRGGAGSQPELASVQEACNVLTVAHLVAAAASARRESRGAHYRSDHPEPDQRWVGHTVLRLSGRQLQLGLAPLINAEV
ncbi:MAG: L-aspartate oxidase [Bacillota bacterium]|nr:L-aspartate oxidase [Bacillota bacterium]